MKIKKMGNIKLRVENNKEEILIDDTYLQECINYINDNSVKRVDVSYPRYKGVDLEFLKHCPVIEEIALESSFLQDISGVAYLKNLKVLNLSEETIIDGKNGIDLGSIASLETLYLTWSHKVKGINKLLNLKELAIWKYKPKNKNLEEFSKLRNLEKIILIQSNIVNLNGICNLEKLSEVELNNLRKLNSLSDINMLNECLTALEIESCKNVQDLMLIGSLESLQNLTLVNCGEISSIDFITKLPNLKSFVFLGTNVLNGDISPCIDINYVMFDHKKHYSHNINFFTQN